MTYRDEFDDPPRQAGLFSFLGAIGPRAAFFAVLIALSFMVGVVWKLYFSKGADSTAGQAVPIIRAEKKPFKAIPEDPGGEDIPHRDSTIFSAFGAKEPDKVRIENLFAEDTTEEPIPRSQLFAGLNTDETNEDGESATQEEAQENEKDSQDQVVARTQEVDLPAFGAQETLKQDASEEKALEKKPVPPPPAKVEATEKPASTKTKVETTKQAAAPVIASGDYYVQLGSVKSRDGAAAEWKKLQAEYPVILAGFSHRVEVANLGDKGTFYRIQAGPTSKDKATATCNEIKKITPGGCLVRKK